MTDPSQWGFETTQVHAGQVPDSATGARALPIYQTTSYVFNDTAHAANLFALKEFGNIYTRIMNPTQDAVEQRIAALEGGLAALLVSSGQAATTIGLLNIAEAGDHIVSSSALYGGTVNLLKYTFRKLGVDVTFVDDQDDLDAWRAAVRPNTKAFFAETIANPKAIVLDIAGVAGVAHEVGVPLVVDNTIATPYLIRPLEHGADVVIHSATKYLGGHGTTIAGVIVDGGTFDYGKDPERFPNYNTPEESYHGLVFARDLGVGGGLGANLAYILKARVQLLRDLGSAISPFNAFLIAQGIETLSLRVERHIENARQVAAYLEAHPQVEAVRWASLDSSPSKALADKYAPKGAGAVLAFEIAGGLEAGQRFVEGLSLHSHVANIGDVRSLAIHPASTTHSQGGDEDRLAAGVTPGLVRLAVGIESIQDIIADLDAGFAAAGGPVTTAAPTRWPSPSSPGSRRAEPADPPDPARRPPARRLGDDGQAVGQGRRLGRLEADDDVEVVVVRDQRLVAHHRQHRAEAEAHVRGDLAQGGGDVGGELHVGRLLGGGPEPERAGRPVDGPQQLPGGQQLGVDDPAEGLDEVGVELGVGQRLAGRRVGAAEGVDQHRNERLDLRVGGAEVVRRHGRAQLLVAHASVEDHVLAPPRARRASCDLDRAEVLVMPRVRVSPPW